MNENLLKTTPIENRCAPEMEESQIQSFYKHRNVFITGGTGFMGKVLIEKLLRSTEVSTLYLLIREKKGKNIHTRIDEIFDDVVFDTLKRECPKFKHRIEAIPGDCSMSGLGICMTDRQTLISKIDIVFHVAATVKFDESLNLAYTINVNGTKEVVDFARQMMNLKSLIYVSTAYANCPRSEIDEKVYDHVIRYEDVKAVLEKLNKSEVELLTPRILGAWPNTYTFTKFLAESLIKDIGGGLPIGIFRPSIVISTYKEPLEGWIDNLYGPTGVIFLDSMKFTPIILDNVDVFGRFPNFLYRCVPEMEESQIQSFYKHRNVFITGGTGFMGKVLIEKLLRSTEVSTLYLLIREKKGKNIHTRIDEIFDDVVFDTLKRECPKFKHRIEAIPGDCSMSGLGICMTDRQTLISKIDIVFHVAATVKFDESLNLAYTINVNGTKEVVDFARQMMNLKSLIYVSTAYANCPRSEIDEKVYDHVIRYEDVKAVLEKLNKSEAELLTPRILGAWPNTYTFTKFLAESLIKDIGGGLPIGIFRPSIVISTYKEPLEGWIDNLYGPTGVAAGAISGVLRVMPCARERTSDVVPVDSCVAGLISAAWDVSSKNPETKTSNQLLVYNYVSSAENPITWREFIELNIIQGEKFPVLNSLWEAFVIFTPDLYWYWILRFFCHTLPGFLIDLVAILTGNKPRMMQLYKTIHKFADTLSYFATRSLIRYSCKYEE
nr:fatty acyl-CoA reductase wat-like [Leptinotarsa decemlineata]